MSFAGFSAILKFVIYVELIYSQMFVQVYLETPNGDKLAEALHSKVKLLVMVIDKRLKIPSLCFYKSC